MDKQIVFTVSTNNKKDIFKILYETVEKNNGKWFDSHLSQLAGETAGIVHTEVNSEKRQDLKDALAELSNQGIHTSILQVGKNITVDDDEQYKVKIYGNFNDSIVQELTKFLSENQINVIDFETNVKEAAVVEGGLFQADILIKIPKCTLLDDIQDKLNKLADQLALVIIWSS